MATRSTPVEGSESPPHERATASGPTGAPARRGVLASGWHDLTHRPLAQEPALDALRSFAVLAVICTHFALPEWPKANGAPLGLTTFPLFYYGWAGVDLFFVLSGLLIGRQVWREVQKTGTVQVGRFLLRRGFRIWPLYFVALAYLAPQGLTTWPDWIFYSNYHASSYPRSWSLSTEEQFYIIVPILLLVTTRFLSLRRQVWMLLGLIGLVQVVRQLTLTHLRTQNLDSETLAGMMQYPIHLHCEPLLIGLLLALLTVTHPQWFQKGPEGRIAWRALAVFVAATTVGLALDIYNNRIFAFLALGLIFGGATYFGMVDRSLLTRPLHAKLFYPISRLSFGMYLNHFLVFPESTAWVVRHGEGLPTTVVFLTGLALGTVISIVVAIVTFLLVEQPFLQLRAKILTGRVRENSAPLAPA